MRGTADRAESETEEVSVTTGMPDVVVVVVVDACADRVCSDCWCCCGGLLALCLCAVKVGALRIIGC